MMPWEHRLNVFVRKVGENKASRITHAQERDIAGYAWTNTRRIVYIWDTGGDENFRLYAVDIDGPNSKALTPFENVHVRIVDRLEDIEDEMLISMNKRDEQIFDVYRLNINTGEMKMVAENPMGVPGRGTSGVLIPKCNFSPIGASVCSTYSRITKGMGLPIKKIGSIFTAPWKFF
jgi:Tol biopolymer transport system component